MFKQNDPFVHDKSIYTVGLQIRETRQSTNKALKVPLAKKEC